MNIPHEIVKLNQNSLKSKIPSVILVDAAGEVAVMGFASVTTDIFGIVYYTEIYKYTEQSRFCEQCNNILNLLILSKNALILILDGVY